MTKIPRIFALHFKTLIFTLFFSGYSFANCNFNNSIIVNGTSEFRINSGSYLNLSVYDASFADAPIAMSTIVKINLKLNTNRLPIKIPIKINNQKNCPQIPAVDIRIEHHGHLIYTNDTTAILTPNKPTNVTLVKVK